MAWLPKVNLGNLGDLAGAVNKFSEQVKSLERNFDSALGFQDGSTESAEVEPKRSSSLFSSPLLSSSTPPATIDSIPKLTLTQPDPEEVEVPKSPAVVVVSRSSEASEQPQVRQDVDQATSTLGEGDAPVVSVAPAVDNGEQVVEPEDAKQVLTSESLPARATEQKLQGSPADEVQFYDKDIKGKVHQEGHEAVNGEERSEDSNAENSGLQPAENGSVPPLPEAIQAETIPCSFEPESRSSPGVEPEMDKALVPDQEIMEKAMVGAAGVNEEPNRAHSVTIKESGFGNGSVERGMATLSMKNVVTVDDSDVQRLQEDKRNLEAVLQSAAKQSQAKADEIGRLTSQVDQLKAELYEIKANGEKAREAELEALREEYQHRLGAAERKVYALTKERDRLQREQGRKTDTSVLLKEKDEIIKQVMAEGEELSKKQASQELVMKKLRTQIRDMEEEKQRLLSRIQVEEARVESIKKDKGKTEKDLQEAVERGQAELAAQKDFYSGALAEAKDALAKAEARIDSEARAETERRLREAGEREKQLLAALEEMRASLTRTEREAEHREGMLRRDIEALEARCQDAEVRHEELVSRMPDSTRPLLRQIEAMQELTSMHVEARAGVERTLNARLLEAEGKCAAAEERERAVNERLTQVLSRMAVMEAQLSMLRAEHAGLARSLEKERTRASENRQELLAASEEAATHEGRAKQLEEEIRAVRERSRKELQEERSRREALEREMETERKALAEYEKHVRAEGRISAEKAVAAAQAAGSGDGTLSRTSSSLPRRHSGTSATPMEESHFLQATLQGSGSFVSRPETPLSPQRSFARGGVTLEQLEAMLRSKEGEIASYQLRLAALESTRDSLAEELVNITTQCEHLRNEVASVPSMRAELEALRRRHTSALELMGERDEQVEELKADIADVKQMYREQIDLLVNQIERIGAQMNGVGR